MTVDLLHIPDFLKRVPGDRPATPSAPNKRGFIMPKARNPAKKAKPRIPEGTRWILYGLHWTDAVIKCLTIKEANRIADAGQIMTPAGEARARAKGKGD